MLMMFAVGIMICFILSFLFFSLSLKETWSLHLGSSFECGFTPYNYSRWSFSIHYFLLALIFLFLDLELCVLMPFFSDMWGEDLLTDLMVLFVTFLIVGLLVEWADKKLDWVS